MFHRIYAPLSQERLHVSSYLCSTEPREATCFTVSMLHRLFRVKGGYVPRSVHVSLSEGRLHVPSYLCSTKLRETAHYCVYMIHSV